MKRETIGEYIKRTRKNFEVKYEDINGEHSKVIIECIDEEEALFWFKKDLKRNCYILSITETQEGRA